MINEKQKQIIKLLLTNKDGYNINQIARILNISVSWTHETLKNLEKEGILLAVKTGNAILFRINWKDKKAEKVCELVLLDERPKEELAKTTNTSSYKKLDNNYIPGNTYKSNTNQQSFGYGINPMGEQGVNNVLFFYANAGAFGSSAYSSSSYSSTPVPPQSLGSRISSNVGSYSLAMHTSSHKSSISGCKYCGPEIRI